MSQSPGPYPIDPDGDPPPRPADPTAPRAKIDKPGLIEDFEEDADFTRDPELDRVVLGEATPPPTGRLAPAPGDDRPEFVRPFWASEHKVWAAVGGVLLIGALIGSGINVPVPTGATVSASKRILTILLTLYTTLLHTGTGVAAVFAASVLQGMRLGRAEVAAARMFAAVAAFMLLFNLHFTITAAKFEETVFAVIAYLVVVAASFRLFKRDPFLFLVGSHFVIWLVVQVGMELSKAAAKPG
ncbi:MAG: hypothetical protein WD749_04570 [Phycisphaerales bacterium]